MDSSTPPPEVFAAAATALRLPVEHLEAFPQSAPLMAGWEFWLVSDGSLPPSDVYVGSREGEAHVVRFEDGLAPFVSVAPVELATAEKAIEYVRMFVRFAHPARRVIDSLDDIAGLDDAVAMALSFEVVPPSAVAAAAGGWTVTAYLNELADLDRAVFSIARGGLLSVSVDRVAEGISIFSAWE